MDVVYPISKASEWGDYNELRFSLRSIEKFFPVNNIFIIGCKPSWATNVIHIPFKDAYIVKDGNLISKIIRACCCNLSDTFLRLSDDQMLLSPYQFKVYYNGTMKEGEKAWLKRCFNTKDVLLTQKKPIYNYDCHVPQVIDRDKYVDIMLQSTWAQGNGLLVNSYYFNTLYPSLTENHAVPDKVNDFLSIGEKIDDNAKKWITERFPDKSRYEI